MSAIARIAFHVDSLKEVITEHEGNFIIDSYFAYVAEDRVTTKKWGRDGDNVSICTDDCGEMAKRELASMGWATDAKDGDEELLHEADANMALRIEAQRRAQALCPQPPMDNHPATVQNNTEELESIL